MPTEDIVALLAHERGLDALTSMSGKLSDPFLFPEMQHAVSRIERSMKAKETIGIFGDYDADGITAALQLIRYFRRHGTEPVVKLPDRLTEGYGLKLKTIEEFREKNVRLLLTVDTGITAHAEIAAAKTAGIDVIVTDHHRPRGGRPAAYAVIHPQVPSSFPNEHLAGAGVAFMLVRALEHLGVWNGIAEDAVLATIGTIGDVVPLTGENRTLVFHGLKLIEQLPPSPLRDLIDTVRRPGTSLTSGDIAFRVVPRINAAGRLEHPSLALRALLEGGAALERLHELNGERQTMVEELTDLALSIVDRTQTFITLRHERFTPGTVGLIAGRLTELFGRPSLVAAMEEDVCVGSLRSIADVDVLQCLEHPAVQPHLRTFGGHAQAAGCTIATEEFERVAVGLSQAMTDAGMTETTLVPLLMLDAELKKSALSLELGKRLSSLEPFGAKNEEPVFLLKDQECTVPRVVGTDGRHLQCRIGGTKAIGFGLGEFAETIASGERIDVACKINVSTWNGREELQYVIRDFRRGSKI